MAGFERATFQVRHHDVDHLTFSWHLRMFRSPIPFGRILIDYRDPLFSQAWVQREEEVHQVTQLPIEASDTDKPYVLMWPVTVTFCLDNATGVIDSENCGVPLGESSVGDF